MNKSSNYLGISHNLIVQLLNQKKIFLIEINSFLQITHEN